MAQEGCWTEAQVRPIDLDAARTRVKSSAKGAIPASFAVLVVVEVLVGLLVTTVSPRLDGMALVAWLTGVTLAVIAPPSFAISHIYSAKTVQQLALSLAREREMGLEARRREFETRLANALEMAATEPRVMTVVGRALRDVAADGRVEILLADNSHAHLERALVSGSDRSGAGCTVESPDQCVAARRGQTQTFSDSEELDACPYLQGREFGRCGAVCVPVSIMGRTVGVVHRAEPLPIHFDDAGTVQLEVLANQLGARIGMLRMMTESQLQASTDGLTGLPNRRAFENEIRRLRQTGADYCVVVADLDNFKILNDTHGHETGDRALRVFSGVLRAGLRPNDVVCRYGGEEFAIAFPGCTAVDALAACERLREALALATRSGDSPQFTASYGIAPWTAGLKLEELIANADTALYAAKHNGRNQAVVFDDSMRDAAPVRAS
jgi:diguanylate cyclase (GGDEF)-like protein